MTGMIGSRLKPLESFIVTLSLLMLAASALAQPAKPVTLRQFLESRKVKEKKLRLSDICPVAESDLAARVYSEYGAVFATADTVVLPARCVFRSDEEVATFQSSLELGSSTIGGVRIGLQAAAMKALNDSVSAARASGLRISPLDGAIAGRRSFGETVRLWRSRFVPALEFWVQRGRISRPAADATLRLPLPEQIERVFAWEAENIFFSTGKNRPIMSSVAPPGTSQHLSMLAFDVVEAGSPAVRRILNRHGWYQTVVNDPPHFTYLGVAETELPARGLRKVTRGGVAYWVPVL